MLYSLTDKLKFDEKPQIEVNGKILTIDNSAETVLKLMDIVKTKGDLEGAKDIVSLLFDSKDRKVIEGLKLSISDYVTFCEICMDLALGNDPDEERGE